MVKFNPYKYENYFGGRCTSRDEYGNANINRQAESEKRKGYWFDVGSLSCRCSECGCKNNRESKYCPECGAYMKGENN